MKKMLFIPIGFYDYDNIIQLEFEKQGYEVTRFTPIGDYNSKMFSRVKNVISKGEYVKKLCYERENEILLKDNTAYDLVFVIVGRELFPEVLKKLRKKQSQAKFVLYLWDDVKRVEHFWKNKDCYDRIITFDPVDSEEYGFDFLPLFFTDKHRYEKQKKIFDLSLMGSFHSNRLEVWEKVLSQVNIDENKLYLYLNAATVGQVMKAIIPSKDKWLDTRYINVRLKSFNYMAEIFKRSRTTIDVQFSSQNGLTLRTIESLAARTKLITTNEKVKDYDFYKYGNVLVVDRDNPVVPQEFIDKKYRELPGEILEKYSITSWVKNILA
ncbi:MAG: hypothetical protein K6G11_05795 [Lachnospiraceae bacterium]|nr:hypothetical protein [Lachnospiraceae bacterium]